MSLSILIFLLIGFGSLISAFMIDGGHLTGLFAGTAFLIVFGGTLGAVGVSFPYKQIKRLPKIIEVAMGSRESKLPQLIVFFKDLSFRTRKSGLLILEAEIDDIKIDPFMKKGLQLVVDGNDLEATRSILELDLNAMSERHLKGAEMFESAGGYAPTMGIIGTVMGLVHVLGKLTEPASLGPSIAVAFLATLYGVSSANLLWLPIASRLKSINEEEYKEKELIIEAVTLIQIGTNPNTVSEKLKSYLDSEELKKYEEINKGI
jgi:chemotaxis protein MotA